MKAESAIHVLLSDLKLCCMRKDLKWGKRIHAKAVTNWHDSNTYVATTLIKMYANCGSIIEASLVFNSIQKPNIVAWTALVLGYAEAGEGHVALNLFSMMKACGFVADSVSYVAALKACTSLALNGDSAGCLERGREVHFEIGCNLDDYVQNALIGMYVKCGSMAEARRVFDSIKKPNVVSWTTLVLGYAENGEGQIALDLFSKMKASKCVPDSVLYIAALKACTSLAVNENDSGKETCLERGRMIHSEIGCHLNHRVQSTLIDMYAKCGSMLDARAVFDNIKKPDVVSWTALLLGYAEYGEAQTALDLFSKMKARGHVPDSVTYVAALKACISLAADGDCSDCLKQGRVIHSEIGCHTDVNVQNTLIEMYAKCGHMFDARQVFECIQKPDVKSWNALLMGYADGREGRSALDLFARMKLSGCSPDSVSYIAALKACTSLASLQQGREIHVEIGCHLNDHVQNTLIHMYAKCGSMDEARRVFEGMQKPNVVSWTSLILGYAETGQGQTALDLFCKMKANGCVPDSKSYIAALKACIAKGVCLEEGKQIHSEIGCHLDHQVQNMLIDMYAKCGSMLNARHVFDSMPNPDVVSWNALLLGYAGNGEGYVALDLFSTMKSRGCIPDSISYVAALKACTSLALSQNTSGKRDCLEWGRVIHSEIGCLTTTVVQNTLINMYANCGSIIEARRVFDSMESPDVVSWTALVLGYAEAGEGYIALDLVSKMKASGCVSDSVSFVAALKACTSLATNATENGKADCLERGKEIHSEVGCHLNHCVQGALIDMYSKCGSMVDARRVFDGIEKPDVVSWTALLLGYADSGEGYVALDLFSRMKSGGHLLNYVTYVAAAKACTSLALNSLGNGKEEFLELGRQIHSEVGCHLNHYVQSTLIDMYSKCGSMADARLVFDSIQYPNMVSCTALLSGYAENGEGDAALDLFSSLKARGCAPDSVTYAAALKACALVGALAHGRKLHREIADYNSHVVTCLVDFYAKCGSMVEARKVFDDHSRQRDIKTWTSLLAGYAKFGDTSSVFDLFKAMQDEGQQPDAITFVSLLLCCSHAGFVEKAREYFEAMPMRYRVTPTLMHYNCMVDVLGRANQLNEASAMIRRMPCNPNAVTWMTLLGACHKWKNVEIGKGAFQALTGMDKNASSVYVLMSQIYGSRGMWDEQERVLVGMSRAGLVESR